MDLPTNDTIGQCKYVDPVHDHQICANKTILEAQKLAPFVVALRQRHADRRQDPITEKKRPSAS